MYFGEYLVSKGIITQDGLVEALVEQVKGIPSVSEILFQKKALTSEVFLKAFALQTEKKIDFRQACRELNAWTEELETAVSQEIQGLKTPLGQILIKRNLTDLSTVTKALDEFLSRIEAPKKPEDIVIASEPQEPEIVSGTVTLDAIDPVMLEDFLQNLSDEKVGQIKNQLSSLEMLGNDVSIQKNVLKSLVDDLHFVRGLMKCVRVDKFESLLSLLETLCIRIVEQLDGGKPTDLSRIASLGASSMDLVQQLKEVLKASSSEAAWFLDDGRRRQFEALFTQVSDACLGGL